MTQSQYYEEQDSFKAAQKVLRNGSHSHTLWKGDINLVESGESAYSDTNEATAQTSWSSAPLNKAQRRRRVEYNVIVEAEWPAGL